MLPSKSVAAAICNGKKWNILEVKDNIQRLSQCTCTADSSGLSYVIGLMVEITHLNMYIHVLID